METEIILTLFIGLLAPLFVFSSILLTKMCDDEKEFSKHFKSIARYSTLLVATIISFILSTYFFLILLILFFIISEFGFYHLDKYYYRRGFTYLLMYISLFINPILITLIAILEFFNMTFNTSSKQTFKLRFEVLLYLGYAITLVVVFLL
ncbi:MAG: hypothetical protein LAT82_03285 [Nanoarchaeota archaeon]|nr:hypothetical protein [Nanoarchaeota archaeon]